MWRTHLSEMAELAWAGHAGWQLDGNLDFRPSSPFNRQPAEHYTTAPTVVGGRCFQEQPCNRCSSSRLRTDDAARGRTGKDKIITERFPSATELSMSRSVRKWRGS